MNCVQRGSTKIPVVITIASSDCRGGAGIQADLRTFAVLGVHGTTAITSVSAQEGASPLTIDDVRPTMIQKQIAAVANDMNISAGKTGMLNTEQIIEAVTSEIANHKFPLIVDPVMVTKSGIPILKESAVNAMKRHLLPCATIVTPNKPEAEKLTGMRIETIADAKTCAERIAEMGPKAVVVKGGRLTEEQAVDILYYKQEHRLLTAPWFTTKTVRGSGCTFSAAIVAQLAKGQDIPEAVQTAKEFVTLAIRFGLEIGKEYGPVNQMAYLHRGQSNRSF